MIYLTVRTIGAILRGVAYLVGAILFGVLPLLAVIAWKCLRAGTVATWKVTTWTIGALVLQSARHAHS